MNGRPQPVAAAFTLRYGANVHLNHVPVAAAFTLRPRSIKASAVSSAERLRLQPRSRGVPGPDACFALPINSGQFEADREG